MQDNDSHKVVMLGQSGVGKTSVVLQLQEKIFKSMVTPTVGSGVILKEVNTSKGPVTLRIWDTAGEERYRSFTGLYSQNSIAGIIVFDVTDTETFDTLEDWISLFRSNCEPNARLYIAGNKNDLTEKRKVSFDEASTFAKDHGMNYYDVSAKSGQNIDLLFDDIGEDLVPSKAPQKVVKEQNIAKEQKENKGCC